jgi:ABC-2 type transport system ATP-binding protein
LKKGELIYNGSVDNLLQDYPNESLERVYLKMAGRQADGDLITEIEEPAHE